MRVLNATRPTRSLFALVLAVGLLASMTLPAQADAASVEVVASGLFNPRGVEVGQGGAIYIAEAGVGGDGPCVIGAEGEECLGFTGAITKLHRGVQSRVIEGLPSMAGVGGFAATGVSDVAVKGTRLQATIGGPAQPRAVQKDVLDPAGGGALGTVIRVDEAAGTWTVSADIAAYESGFNPDGGEDDSNVNSLAIGGRGTTVVADAGGNSLLSVGANSVSTLAVFDTRFVEAPPFLGLPPGTLIPMQSVPTSVVQGPDGAWYVGELTGFPFEIGAARVHRVVPGQAPTVYAEGFTNIMDLAFAPNGTLYVLELAHNSLLDPEPVGAIIAVATDGVQSVVYEGLFFPGGMDYHRGALYVSNCGICPGFGELLQIRL